MSSDEVSPTQKDDAMQQPTETDAGSSSTPESSDKTGTKIIDFSWNQEAIWKSQVMQNRVRDGRENDSFLTLFRMASELEVYKLPF